MKLTLTFLFTFCMVLMSCSSPASNPSSATNANSTSQTLSTLSLGIKAQQVEEKILRGEALNSSDIEGLSKDELRILRNVHFARYGRKYERPGLGDYFYTRSWYKPSDDYKDSMITTTDKANINLILSIEKPTNPESVSVQNSNLAETNSSIPTNNSTSETKSSDNTLTNASVQSAVNNFMSDFTKGGNIIVEGVQELPKENAATVDLKFSNWICSTTYEGGLSKQKPPPVTYDRFGMPSSTFGLRLVTYNTSGIAVLKHYNDGRWVLKQVRAGNGFNAVIINGTQEIR